MISEASTKFGSQCIVAAVDAKKEKNSWIVYSHGGSKNTGIDALYWMKRLENLGAGEILLTSMDRDGTKKGFDLELLSRASDLVGKKISMEYEGNDFLLNFDKTIFSKNIKSNHIISLAKKITIEFLENDNSFSAQEWRELYKLSEETFVEETDSLKKGGAGAGLTDND